ncbi:MAG TPA: hypothetical protein VKZ61_05115, partial [Thermomicrobiales bacterium]|nr:hypothetical protein [Thermomicrobiales bacterium]
MRAVSLERRAAGDGDDLAGDVAGIVGGEEDVGGGELGGLAGASERCVLAERLLHLLVHGRDDERGPDRARSDGVDADALFDDLLLEGAGEGDNAALGRRIVDKGRAR